MDTTSPCRPVDVRTVAVQAMGGVCAIRLDGPAPLGERAARRVLELERTWSRFRPDSELVRLNRRAGQPTVVSEDLLRLVEAARTGWQATGGRFDPTVHDALCANGYDIDLDTRRRLGPAAHDTPSRPTPGLGGLTIDRAGATVTLPHGVRLDPGGIGKGLAADLVACEAVAAGARWAVVDIGGDLALQGDPPGPGWTIAVEGPEPHVPLAHLTVGVGGVATSSPARRRWRTRTGVAHHVIDPATGRPARPPWASVTVVAAAAWWAEVQATSVLLGDRPPATGPGAVTVLAFGHDGSRSTLGTPAGSGDRREEPWQR